MLRLYNTMTRSVDEFRPIEKGKADLYTCGLTVYNYAHIGNLRTYIFEDILKRTLQLCGYEVRHVMNITDVGHLTSDADVGEDKMEAGAAREGKTAWEIAEFYQRAFVKDLHRLNILEPDIWCKATDHIAEQIELVRTLEQKGYTYVIEGDGVYFDTSKLPDYGKLVRLDVEGLRAGARVEMVAGKKNPTDFALWKFSPKDTGTGKKRQMEWPSPWGVGFPGWHVECSAMAVKYLGERLDIHCGGVDHQAVHHTNEIAQTEAAYGHKWVNWWMHGEWLVLPKEGGEAAKMSKSSGEFLTLDFLIQKGYDPLAFRYFCLNAHYRQQLTFTWESLDAAANALGRLKRMLLELRPAYKGNEQPIEKYTSEFRQAVEDDLNMPRTLATMWNLLKDVSAEKGDIYATLLAMDRVLGLNIAELGLVTIQVRSSGRSSASASATVTPAKETIQKPINDAKETIQKLIDEWTAARNAKDFARADASREQLEKMIQPFIDERLAARQAKNFARADEIRKQLSDMGITLEDSADGTTWRRN
jgi:cysteinyl-tRNA synthetase